MKCERCGEVNPAEIHTCSPQEPQPEPEWVTWLDCLLTGVCAAEGHSIQKLQREWQGLTDEEKLIVNQMWNMVGVDGSIKAIETRLKEKNHDS
jgi:hypothetical protein